MLKSKPELQSLEVAYLLISGIYFGISFVWSFIYPKDILIIGILIMTEEWCCDILQNLKIGGNRSNLLEEIRKALNEFQEPNAAVTHKLLSAPEIYECVEELANGGNSRDPAIDILSICMSNLSIRQDNFSHLLERAINHPHPKIRSLALNTILRELEKHSDEFLSIGDDLLVYVFKALEDEETAVGLPAIGILSILLEDKLEKCSIKNELLRELKNNSIIKCRVIEIAVNLAKRSPATLEKVEYLLNYALAELDNDDVLVQVSLMELLFSLAEEKHGLLFLEQHYVLEVISRRVEGLKEDPMSNIKAPGIMKFVGKLATLYPRKIILGYPQMIPCLFEYFSSDDISIPIAFDTIANLCQTSEGKLLLEANYSSELRSIFEKFSTHLRNIPSDMKSRAFKSLEIIFSPDGLDELNSELSDILKKWFCHLAGSANMQFLLDFCRNPFPDIKISCLLLIKAICHHPWGITAFKNTGGFVEYILDRKLEFNKDAQYVKYEVIKLLAESTIFDVHTQLKLREYVNNGPYFVQGSLEIAFAD